jgi:RNA polymerase sigma-70 factor (ECF subfamily)
VHAARRITGKTDWPAIVVLYDGLLALTGSPVVAVNRAVALAETADPSAAIAALDEIAGDPRLIGYQPYWAARAALLARMGERSAADAVYGKAMALEPDPAIRRFLAERRAALQECYSPAT